MEYQMWSDMLRIPSGYERMAEGLRKSMEPKVKDRLDEYIQQKVSLGLNDVPKAFGKKISISEKERIENSILLRQAEYFGKLARDAPLEAKPLLYHYAENSLFGFFVYTLFPYQNHSEEHGLSTLFNDEIDENYVQVHKEGFFARIVDVYHLLDADTQFSPFVYQNGASQKNLGEYSLLNTPKLSLEKIIGLKGDLNNTSNENGHDLLDFLILFLASNMARYRPSLWIKITDARENIHLVWFNRAFERFDSLYHRLLSSMHDLRAGATARTRLLNRYMPKIP